MTCFCASGAWEGGGGGGGILSGGIFGILGLKLPLAACMSTQTDSVLENLLGVSLDMERFSAVRNLGFRRTRGIRVQSVYKRCSCQGPALHVGACQGAYDAERSSSLEKASFVTTLP